jgi:DNA/RNA endonuclease YhcR with UshA esterase domain
MRRLLFAGLAASCLFAHHSTAIYDLVHGTIIAGEVKRFEWENPHAHIYLDVNGENGDVEHWLVEMESPALLGRFGWKKDTLKPGDQITVTGGRAKDNSFRIRAAYIVLPDGRKLPALPPVDN